MSADGLSEDIRRQIGQHFIFGFHGHEPSEDIVTLIRDYYVGNVILMKRNVQSMKQVHELTSQLQQIAKDAGHSQPLLIGTDQENGMVSSFSPPSGEAGTQFPGAMALAATDDTELARQVSEASAKELKLAGIQWAYSPVADVNSEPKNPVIAVRSYGDDPTRVAQLASAVSEGLVAAGVASCAKHFPGHGDTHIDSHLALPTIMKSQTELDATELIPFQNLVSQDIPSIMTGHMALPRISGSDLPASLAPTLTHNLLRDYLNYKGLVVTDCLEMDAVAQTYTSEAGAVMALQAGADIAMICHRIDRQRGALDQIYQAVREGKLSLEALAASEERIARFKLRFVGTWTDALPTFDEGAAASLRAANRALSARAYAASTALIRSGASSILPLGSHRAIALFTPQMQKLNPAVDDAEGVIRDEAGRVRNTAGPSYLALASSVERRVGEGNVRHIVYGPDDPPATVDAGTAIIFATRNADQSVWQGKYLQQLLAQLKEPSSSPLVVLSTCTPYDVLATKDAPLQVTVPHAALATFEFTAPAFEAAVAVVFGEAVATGKLPVRAAS